MRKCGKLKKERGKKSGECSLPRTERLRQGSTIACSRGLHTRQGQGFKFRFALILCAKDLLPSYRRIERLGVIRMIKNLFRGLCFFFVSACFSNIFGCGWIYVVCACVRGFKKKVHIHGFKRLDKKERLKLNARVQEWAVFGLETESKQHK